MHLETYPISVNVGTQWKQVEDFKFEIVQSNFTFLYIGQDKKSEWLTSYFQSGVFTEDYIQAELLIERMGRKNMPDVIFIDLPFNKTEYLNFYSFLQKKKLLQEVIVIYNEVCLDTNKIKLLRQKELVDDVVCISSNHINYANKISFLKKIKNYQELSLQAKSLTTENEKVKVGFFKRAFDITISLLAILLILPLLLLIALAVKLESKGPIIYTSMRAGRGFKIFKFYKFRTMVAGADRQIEELAHLNQYQAKENGARFLKIENDPRVTKLGRILRKTSLDELPQLFNVLKGDMSIVGNRPLPLYEASTLTTNEFVERFMAPAGITGLWQIKKRGRAEMSTEERINLDILYARTASPILDLWIMARTPSALFQKTNV